VLGVDDGPEAKPGRRVTEALDGRVRVRELDGGALQVTIGPCGGRAVYARMANGVWSVSESIHALALADKMSALAHVLPSWVAATCTLDTCAEPLASPLADVLRLPSSARTTLTPGHAAAFEPLPFSTAAPNGTLRTLLEHHLHRYPRGPIAVTTGGLYSSSILALAHRVRGDAMCVSIDLGGEDNDRPFVESLCRHLGITPHFVTVEDGLREIPPDFTMDGAPLASPGAALELAAFRRAKELSAVAVLSGAGGDELFEEDRSVAARILESGRIRDAFSIARPHGAPLSDLRARLLRPLARRRVPWSVRRAMMALRGQGKLPLPAFFGALPRALRDEAWLRGTEDPDFFDQGPDERVALSFRSPHFDSVAFHRRLSEAAVSLPRLDPFLEPDVLAFAMRAAPWEHFEGDLPRG
jgi:hypothetical protein